MLKDFELAAKRHSDIKKEAMLGMIAKPLLAAGKWAVKNPLKAAGTALTGAELASNTKHLTKSVRGAARSVPGTFTVGPTF
jgi:hypothetical protein